MIITVIAGFALAYVYKITKDPIAVTEQKAKEEAYKAVFMMRIRLTAMLTLMPMRLQRSCQMPDITQI